MKKSGYIFGFLLLFCVACKKLPLSYTVPLQNSEPVTGEVWRLGDSNSPYKDIYITDQYYIFSKQGSDTVLQVFDKKDSIQCVGSKVKSDIGNSYYTIDFLKSNTRYKSEKNDVWIVENKKKLKQLRLQNDLLSSVQTIPLSFDILESTSYNFTKEEVYGVPTKVHPENAFYFFQSDSGYYWVETHGMTKNARSHYKKNPYAFLSTLSVNEPKNAIACAFLFINQIQFFDLRGEIVRSVKLGNDNAAPVNDATGSLDYEKSVKYMLDVCSSDKHVYCLYNGSKDFDEPPLIVVFKWDGTHVKTYQSDRLLKKIAFDEAEKKLVALAANEWGGRDVILYSVK